MLNSYAVLLALCLGQSEVTTSPRSGFSSSDNFVVYAPDQELADEVLKNAEQLRTNLARAWLGKELPAGVGACMIHVKLSSEDSASTWPIDHPKRRYHLVTIRASREKSLGTTLAHELTHVVFATEFGKKLPDWANEGAASLQDDNQRRANCRAQLAQFARTADWPNLIAIIRREDRYAGDHTFYTVGTSLTEFLLDRRDPESFLKFAIEGKETGWETAARSHYGFRSLGELETQWRDWVIATSTARPSRTVAIGQSEKVVAPLR